MRICWYQGIAWAFGGMIFALVYCTARISGGHINPAVTFGLFLTRKLSLTRALFYIVMQCLGAICGAGVLKGFTVPREMPDSYVPLLAPLPIGCAVFLVHLATIPITGTNINRSRHHLQQITGIGRPWINWVGPFIGAV